jgi:uncharacterized protein YlaN (UPF0358 family)
MAKSYDQDILEKEKNLFDKTYKALQVLRADDKLVEKGIPSQLINMEPETIPFTPFITWVFDTCFGLTEWIDIWQMKRLVKRANKI